MPSFYKNHQALICVLLCLCLLAGCTTPSASQTAEFTPSTATESIEPTPVPTPSISVYSPTPATRGDVRFSELEYVRPNVDEYKARVQEFVADFNAADNAADQIKIYLEMERYSNAVSDMITLANINFSLNVNTETQAENDYCTEFAAAVEDDRITVYDTLLNSTFQEEMTAYFSEDVLNYMRKEVRDYDPRIVALYEQVSKLGSEYTRISTEYKEKSLNYDGGAISANDAISILAYSYTPGSKEFDSLEKALLEYYDDLNKECDIIYAQILGLLTQIAEIAGFRSYPEYALYQGPSYDLGTIRTYIDNIKETMIPVMEALYEQGESVLGELTIAMYYPAMCPALLMISDTFSDASDDAATAEQKEYAAASKVLRELMPITGELLDYLEETQMIDVTSSPTKSSGAFSTFFFGIRQPFIFSESVMATTIIHESGHALNSYSQPEMDITERFSSGTEIREVHSMGLEVLAFEKYDILYGESANYAITSELFNGLQTMLTQAMYYEFELACFDNPTMTREERNSLYAGLVNEYCLALPGLKLYSESGLDWVMTLHHFEAPLYTIDYTLAQSVAFEIWEIQQEDPQDAMDAYMAFLLDNQENNLSQRLANAGFQDVFEKENMQALADKLNEIFISEKYLEPLYLYLWYLESMEEAA